MILGFGILMLCRFTWQFMKSFLDSTRYLVPSRGAVWGTRLSRYCHLLKGFGIYMIGILGR